MLLEEGEEESKDTFYNITFRIESGEYININRAYGPDKYGSYVIYGTLHDEVYSAVKGAYVLVNSRPMVIVKAALSADQAVNMFIGQYKDVASRRASTYYEHTRRRL